MVAICPCCHQSVTTTDLLVSVDAGVAVRNNVRVDLTPHEARAMHELRATYPGVASYDGLSWSVYSYVDEPENMRNSIHVLMRRLRSKVAPLNISIVAVRGAGYRLEVA